MNNNQNRNGQNRNTGYPANGVPQNGRPVNNVNRYPQPNRQSVPTPPVKHKSRARVRAYAIISVVVGVILLLVLTAALILLSRDAMGDINDTVSNTEAVSSVDGVYVVTNNVGEVIAEVTLTPDTSEAETAAPETNERTGIAEGYIETEIPSADYTKGYQILVNYDYPYDFENDFEILVGYNMKKRNFFVFDTNTKVESRALYAFRDLTDAFSAETGIADVLITEGYRTYEYQKEIFDAKAYTIGEEGAKLTVAVPGHSEHHSGLAMDLSVYGNGRSFVNLPEYPEWFNANAHKYGYILRYPEDKTDITKISYEYWHYRYIGVPHAYYMVTNNLCLEEYIELLKGYDYYSPLVFTDDMGDEWEIYYTAKSDGEMTKVIVPETAEYEISGNNADGFIVTVKIGE